MKEFYDYLAKNNLSPNGFYVLHSTFNGYAHPNFINVRSEQYRLALCEYMKEVDGIYVLTTVGKGVLRNGQKILEKAPPKKKIPFEEWQENIVRYNEFFPKGKRPDSAHSYRTNPKELYDRFIWFFNEYPEYTWDLVFQAVEQYADAFRESGDYMYMANSKYFIKKEDKNKQVSSTLGSMCWNILEGNDVDISKEGFHYFGP
jgi:hypothetical protein